MDERGDMVRDCSVIYEFYRCWILWMSEIVGDDRWRSLIKPMDGDAYICRMCI